MASSPFHKTWFGIVLALRRLSGAVLASVCPAYVRRYLCPRLNLVLLTSASCEQRPPSLQDVLLSLPPPHLPLLCRLLVRALRAGGPGGQQRNGYGHGRRDEPRLRQHAVLPTFYAGRYPVVPGMGTCERGCDGGDVHRTVPLRAGGAVDSGGQSGYARTLGATVCRSAPCRVSYRPSYGRCVGPVSFA